MVIIRIENQELRVFAAVIEQHSFNKAAEQLCISQSAVSQTLANLERKLNTLLLQRSPMKLTDAGTRLLFYARKSAVEEKRVLTDMAEIQRGKQSLLSLAINSMINRYHAGTLVNRYCGLNPHALLSIEEIPSREIISAVMGGKVELGIGSFQTNMDAFETIYLFQDVRSLVISRFYPEIDKVIADPKNYLKKVPFITSYNDETDHRYNGRLISERFSHHLKIPSIGLRLELLAAGRGAGFVSEQVLLEDTLCEDLRVIDKLPFARTDQEVGIFYRKGIDLSEGAAKFIEICIKRWQS